MPYFQNLFDQEFQGYLVLSDRQLAPTFKVSPNQNLQSKQIAWNKGPYNLSTYNSLEFNFSWDVGFKNWSKVSINVSGADPSSTSVLEVIETLNAEPTFSTLFSASVYNIDGGDTVLISKKTAKDLKFYFSNSGAESIMGFNKRAGVAELPIYFERHTIANVKNFQDSVGLLIKLDETDPTDQAVIENAGFVPADMKEDWELLRGRAAGLFNFQKITVDGDDRISQVVEYPAGAIAGDLARRINYSYTGSNTKPSQITEVPYVLLEADLVDPV
jgi:hypothetical protein